MFASDGGKHVNYLKFKLPKGFVCLMPYGTEPVKALVFISTSIILDADALAGMGLKHR